MKNLVITVSGESAEELKNNILEVARGFGLFVQGDVPQAHSAAEADFEALTVQTPATSASAASATAAKKPGRPKKAEVETAPEEVAPTPAPSLKEGAFEALQTLNSKKGLAVVRQVLGSFKVARFSEINETDYAKFTVACLAAAG